MPPADHGVTVPPELCRQLAYAAVIGLDAQRARGGGGAVPRALTQLIAELAGSPPGTPRATMEAPAWLTCGQAAELTGTSARYVRRLAGAGRLIARRHGRTWMVDRQSATEYGRTRGHGRDDD